MIAPILILSGSPGVGKSTIGAMVADTFEPSAVVRADDFFDYLATGFIAPWLPESDSQNQRVIEITVEQTAGRGLVTAGTGSNSTREAITLTKAAEKAGADACLLVSPYYNKPSQRGLFEHFKAIAECCPMPVILYNVPGRSAVSIDVETVARLAELPNIVAIKEASGDVGRISATLHACDITVLSGDDALTLPMMSTGADTVSWMNSR